MISGSPPSHEALAVIDEFPGVVVNLDIKRTAPQVEPYEEHLARASSRFSATRTT